MLTRHIFLIGMPGSGKSSLGRKVASILRLPFIDTDTRIKSVMGCEVSEMFERYGEDAFRIAETNMLIHITRLPPSIISTGGGTVTRDVNRHIMRDHGVLLHIDRPLEMIMSDIKLDRRPLLAAKGLPEVERLYHERIGIYRGAADYTLVNSGSYFDGVNGLEKLIRTHFDV